MESHYQHQDGASALPPSSTASGNVGYTYTPRSDNNPDTLDERSDVARMMMASQMDGMNQHMTSSPPSSGGPFIPRSSAQVMKDTSYHHQSSNSGKDSHARLFGAPVECSLRSKPNFMKSDIFGTGLGSNTGYAGSRTTPRLSGIGMGPRSEELQTKLNDVARSPGRGSTDDGGSGDTSYREYVQGLQASQTHLNEGLSHVASFGDIPMVNARENGGNPLTGAGYHEGGRVQRRRQFTKNQFATSKFW